MSSLEKKRRTILHYGTDRVVLLLRARGLNEMGYHVLNASDGFEAIKLATQEHVDAVVLDLDRNHAEVALVATEIKRCRPQLPTILLADETTHPSRANDLADALVPRRDNVKMLVTALENILTGGAGTPRKMLPE
jgi:DNA-binding NtrC family response regulator